MAKTVLKIENLHVDFNVHAGVVKAIRGVNIKIKEGEIVCLVGESGSGKSVTAKSIMGLLPENTTTISDGHIILNEIDIVNYKEKDFTAIRGSEAAMIFQDPMTALNPVVCIGEQIKEALLLHHLPPVEKVDEKVRESYIKAIENEKKIREVFYATKKEIKKLDISPEEKVIKYNENIALFNKDIKAAQKELRKLTKSVDKNYYKDKVNEMLNCVGIHNAETMYKQFPHQLSGGMRQRIVVAIALSCEPKLLIADEPTTALDVTIQAQILELIKSLQKEFNFAVLFITHDLGVVANMADHVYVMYAGKIVECGQVEEVFYNPQHPYTWGLLSSMPDLETDKSQRLYNIPGTPPNLLHPPVGDAFAARNEYALKIDFELEPPLFKISDTHYAATWLLDERSPKVEKPQVITDRINRFKKLRGEK